MKKYHEAGQILLGDCRELLGGVEPDSVALIHTSPPYNISRQYADFEDNRSREEYLHFIDSIVLGCFRALKKGGSMFWQTGYTVSEEGEFITPIDHLTYSLFHDAGFRLKDRIIWRYFGGMSFKKKFTNKHETILWWVKPGAEPCFDVMPVREKSKEYDARNHLFGRNPGNVWEVDRVAHGSTDKTSHIAVFPEEISDRIVLAASREGDLCLDPFSGSGTFCKVAKSRGRRYLGFEIAPTYYKESLVRLGRQASGEYDSVLSALLKMHVFSKRATASLKDIRQDLTVIAGGSNKKAMLEERLGKVEFQALMQGNDEALSKKQKVELWKNVDVFFDSQKDQGPLHKVDEAYREVYKLHREFNGAKRFVMAFRWLERFHQEFAREAQFSATLARLVCDESGSFAMKENKITLRGKRLSISDKGDISSQPNASPVLLFRKG